jgi:hypothetical protein
LEFREKGVILLVLQLENNYLLKKSSSLPSSKQGFTPLELFLPTSTLKPLPQQGFATLGLFLPTSTILVFLGISLYSVETLQDDLYVRYRALFIVEKWAKFV